MTSRGPEPAALRRRAPEPVVVVKPISDRGSHAGVVWFLSEQENRFLLRYQEWDYLDGAHPAAEDVFYLVADEGKQRFGGLGVQARRSLVGDSTADSEVGFCIGSRSPTGIPAVFAAVESENHPGARITRIDSLGTGVLRLRIDGEVARTSDELTAETVAWLAIEQGLGTLPSGR